MSLGSPGPMETLSDLPEGLSTGKSELPEEKLIVRVPPPPQPSFFTATVMLKKEGSECNDQNTIQINFMLQSNLEVAR